MKLYKTSHKMHLRKIILYLLLISCFFSFGKLNGQEDYDQLRTKYENLKENDINALRHIRLYIQKAKHEKNKIQLVQGYRDVTFFSPDKSSKIQYADSAIIAAKGTEDNSLISTTFLLKGSLYYFYFKSYPKALTEYLHAYEYSKKGSDSYLKFKIQYQMGLVKSYLGYYEEALEHFDDCVAYFGSKIEGKNHPNQIFNDSKGYLNSMHQAIVCYQRNNKYSAADSLTEIGLAFTARSADFPLEQAYFLKSKGISDYYHKNYKAAQQSFSKALPVLNQNMDVYWTAVSEFYIGKSLLSLGETEAAITQFGQVDALFRKEQFIFPELQENYELLIANARNNNKHKEELAYTNSLLKVDSILKKDFPYLSSRIHREYDNRILQEAKRKLEKRGQWSLGLILLLTGITGVLFYWAWRYYRDEKQTRLKYIELEKKLLKQKKQDQPLHDETIFLPEKSLVNKNVFSDLHTKMKAFEENKTFIQKGLTVEQLAASLGTNKSYLSQYINDTHGMNFSKYLSALRIDYITQLMYDDPKYLLLKVQGLADECGISSRQNFSDLFQEINGIRPTDFIRKRKKELQGEEK